MGIDIDMNSDADAGIGMGMGVVGGLEQLEQQVIELEPTKALQQVRERELAQARSADEEGRAALIAGLSHQLYLLLQEEGSDADTIRLRNAACYLWAELLAQPSAREPMKTLLMVTVQQSTYFRECVIFFLFTLSRLV